jgi:hypothetical protein
MPKKKFPSYIFDPKVETTSSFRKRWGKCNKGRRTQRKLGKCLTNRHHIRPFPHRMPTQQSWVSNYPWTSS